MVKPIVKASAIIAATTASGAASGAASVSSAVVQQPPPTAIASLSKMNELHTIAQKVEWKTNYLMKLKDDMERLPIFHQIEILRILQTKNTNLNENKNGIFINITKLSDETLLQIEEYIEYVNAQEKHLNEAEEQKKMITREYFEAKSK
jgi:hypothetical protein